MHLPGRVLQAIVVDAAVSVARVVLDKVEALKAKMSFVQLRFACKHHPPTHTHAHTHIHTYTHNIFKLTPVNKCLSINGFVVERSRVASAGARTHSSVNADFQAKIVDWKEERERDILEKGTRSHTQTHTHTHIHTLLSSPKSVRLLSPDGNFFMSS